MVFQPGFLLVTPPKYRSRKPPASLNCNNLYTPRRNGPDPPKIVENAGFEHKTPSPRAAETSPRRTVTALRLTETGSGGLAPVTVAR